MTKGVDVSEWQLPGTVDFSQYDFVIIRTSHGLTEDKHWREHYNACISSNQTGGKPAHIGFYHYSESGDPRQEASYFKFLAETVPHSFGQWLDVETGQSAPYVDAFRNVWDTGVYSNWWGFSNAMGGLYNRFERNWVAWLNPGGPPMRWLLMQVGQQGTDIDVGPNLPAIIDPSWSGFHFPNL